MTTTIMGELPPGCRDRLLAHYGPAVAAWMDEAPRAISTAAQRLQARVTGYHDAGYASALALATLPDGTSIVLKAWFDRHRFATEVAALRHWSSGPVAQVLATSDDLAVAAIALIGGKPGGATRPLHDYRAVAAKLSELHAMPAPQEGFPKLRAYLDGEVRPRVQRRLAAFGGKVPWSCVEAGTSALTQLTVRPAQALLHADLYRENVLFEAGQPVFIDPLPMVGDPAFDWAFWTVYYDLASDPIPRFDLAIQLSGLPPRAIGAWALSLCLDGLLYYVETSDSRVDRMIHVLHGIASLLEL